MRSHGLGIGHQAVRGSLDNHDQPVEGVPVTPTVNSASVIDLRAYAGPSVVPTLVLVDLQKEYMAAPRILALPHAPQALANCRIALTHARTKGFPVAFVRWLGRSTLFNRATPFSGWIEGFEPTVRISRKEGQRFTACRSTVSHQVGPVLVRQDVVDFHSVTYAGQALDGYPRARARAH